ncbi:MAG: branched-chain amino acid transaminase, partial [Planctomycetota bacterium]
TLHYGLGAFEGIRAYEFADGTAAVFRLREHIERIFNSCHIIMLEIPYSVDEIIDSCLEMVRRNKLRSCYIRPLVYMGDGAMGLGANNPTRVSIITFPWGTYLGEDGIQNGIRVLVSSFTRMHVNINMVRAKICGQYTNSILAKRLALMQGMDETILLDSQGYVCEATGENIFVIRKGIIQTPPTSSPILEGLTRDTVITLAKDLGYELIEQKLTRDELYIADEIFLTGTAAEVTPIREIDFRQIGTGKPGPITRKLQTEYFAVVKGERDQYSSWLSRV